MRSWPQIVAAVSLVVFACGDATLPVGLPSDGREVCDDGIDNDDLDVLVDCDDEECARHPACRDDSPSPQCGDGTCSDGEESACPTDCAHCGDDRCEHPETPSSCPTDCGPTTVCGDGTCSSGEESSCPTDCVRCGDGSCDHPETRSFCPADCGSSSECGDGLCDPGESCDFDCLDDNWDLPETFRVTFLQAVVAPVKADGCAWDGPTCDRPSDEAFDALGELLFQAAAAASGPLGSAAGWAASAGFQGLLQDILSDVLSSAYSHLIKPDPRGHIDLGNGETVAVSHYEDTFTPDLGGRTLLFPSDYSGFVYLYLEDEDVFNHDPIGRVAIGLKEVMGAYADGNALWIHTGDLVDGILQVKLSVTAE